MAFTKIAAAGIGSTGTVTLENLTITGVLNVPTITGAASTANVRTNSLVVSGVTTTGSIVATNGTFSGNVTIGGTLTYEDVTNIDSIGVVTARNGVVINSGGLIVTSGVSTLGVTTLTTLTVTGNAGFTTTSHIQIPSGTSAERPGTPTAGMIRYNSENQQFEGYAAAWGGFGGAAGASGNAVFYENDTNVTASYQITSGKNAMSAGPITLNAGVVVTIPSGSVWTVV